MQMRSLEELNTVQASVERPLLTRKEYDALVEWAVRPRNQSPGRGTE